ncbi:MAG TPA: hypothetical protein VFO54_11385 [Chryseosolibacter sp.]|nr:hypothetical protein [Chryseosolibacter sp.]
MEFSRIIFITLTCAVLLGCNKNSNNADLAPFHESEQFKNYWHAGKAEVNSYELTQSRYGETRAGKAVLIFVTEDLSKKLQVKLDNPSGRNKINVLKLNFTKKFITGIYPYSLMLSVFTPIDRRREPASLKATMSSQEWCGQVYTQVNLRGNRYAVKSHSYFEQEADERFSVRQALLEDEVWNLIRIDHENLPLGKFDLVPGLFFTRLNHADIKVRSAIGNRSETDSAYVYALQLPEHERVLTIRYEKEFPFRILGWKETWKEKGKTMETTARLDKTLYTDYWTKNKKEFEYLRDSLNLPTPY